MQKLTERQKQIYDFIEKRINTAGYPPSIIEIGEHFGFTSTATVSDHLKSLEKKGFIRRKRGRSRGLELLKKKPTKGATKTEPIPLLIRIVENCDLLSDENTESNLSLPEITHPEKDSFAIKIEDTAMNSSGIFQDDIIIATSQTSASPGEIVVACISGKPVIRRLVVEGNHVFLKPDNKEIFSEQISHTSNNRVIGKIVTLVRNNIGNG